MGLTGISYDISSSRSVLHGFLFVLLHSGDFCKMALITNIF